MNKLSFDRVVNFSDAVFAIVITILVLELKVPHAESEAELIHKLEEMVPRFIGFLTSFVLVGILWLEHHKLFRMVTKYNVGLLILNFVFLLFVCFVPFPTGLVCEYPKSFVALCFYYSTIGLASLMRVGILVWSHRTGLMSDVKNYKKMLASSLTIPVVCVASLLFAMLFGNLIATGVFVFAPVIIKLITKYAKN